MAIASLNEEFLFAKEYRENTERFDEGIDMRQVSASEIISAVEKLCGIAATRLPEDVLRSLKESIAREESPLGKSILKQCVENAEIAAAEDRPICQDTGFAVLFVDLGAECLVVGDTVENACHEGVRRGYRSAYLRNSIVADPLFNRANTGDNTPAIIHLRIVSGDHIRIILAPKGGGSENMTSLAMLKPSDGESGVVDFVVNSVVAAGGNPCPPVIVGVGIGGTAEKCVEIAKRALLRSVGSVHEHPYYAALEEKICERINRSGVGPQGLGGTVSALAVHIETFPTHIASMPVAVNLNCHAARHVEVTL